MKAWSERPSELAHLLNPAFCCIVVTSSLIGYMGIHPEGIPYPMVFLVLPVVLHKPTRNSLPPNTRTSLAAWMHEHSESRVLFYERLISLKPFTREALLFGLSHDWLALDPNGLLQARLTDRQLTSQLQKLGYEPKECAMRARFLGRWFASGSSAPAVMATWGVRA